MYSQSACLFARIQSSVCVTPSSVSWVDVKMVYLVMLDSKLTRKSCQSAAVVVELPQMPAFDNQKR